MSGSDIRSNIISYFKLYINDKSDNKKTMIPGLPPMYPAYSFVNSGYIGVFIQSDNYVDIDENFQNSKFKSMILQDMGPCLVLETKLHDCRSLEHFASLCVDLVSTTDEGDERLRITSNPFGWFQEVSKVWGNRNYDRLPTAVLAELYSLHTAYVSGYEPVWEGPNGALVDIRGNNVDIEVKSSTSVDNTEITISRELQLKKADNDLHLYYVCLQESDSGISINDVIAKLVQEDGFDEFELEMMLSKQGLSKGKNARLKKYLVTKLWDFKVDDDFPKITPESFKDGKMPDYITKITYTIDVSGLEYKNILG